jgi:hypothetical protein
LVCKIKHIVPFITFLGLRRAQVDFIYHYHLR